MRPKKISDQAILEVVRECLSQQGTSVSTKDIADKLGISQASLFKRFGTKVKLFQASILLPFNANRLLQRLALEPTDQPVKEQLQSLMLEMQAFFNEVVPVFSALHASGMMCSMELSSEKSPPIQARKYLTAWLKQLQNQGRIRSTIDAESISIALIGVVQHRTFRTELLKDSTITRTEKEYISSVIDVLWQGLDPVKEA